MKGHGLEQENTDAEQDGLGMRNEKLDTVL